MMEEPGSAAAHTMQPPQRRSALPFHHEAHGQIVAPAEAVFDHLDDHNRLSRHMSRSSWMMAGSRMSTVIDSSQGKAVGSQIRLSGRVLGLSLAVEEVVTERVRPVRKAWETTGTPRLLVIGHYRLGFEIRPSGASSAVRIFIDYALPEGPVSRLLGRALARMYARWCVDNMLADAIAHFGRPWGAEGGKGAA